MTVVPLRGRVAPFDALLIEVRRFVSPEYPLETWSDLGWQMVASLAARHWHTVVLYPDKEVRARVAERLRSCDVAKSDGSLAEGTTAPSASRRPAGEPSDLGMSQAVSRCGSSDTARDTPYAKGGT